MDDGVLACLKAGLTAGGGGMMTCSAITAPDLLMLPDWYRSFDFLTHAYTAITKQTPEMESTLIMTIAVLFKPPLEAVHVVDGTLSPSAQQTRS
jgi:hypothetical protein